MVKSEVVKMLNEGIVDIEFTKVDGSTRVMQATLSSDYISYQNPSNVTNVKKNPDSVQPVWDVQAGSWRSFRWSSVTRVNDTSTGGVALL